MTSPRRETASALARNVAPEERKRIVVVIDRQGRAQVFDRGEYARRLARRDQTAAFLVAHERVGRGEVLVVEHSVSLGAKVRRVAMSDVLPIAVRVEGEDES